MKQEIKPPMLVGILIVVALLVLGMGWYYVGQDHDRTSASYKTAASANGGASMPAKKGTAPKSSGSPQSLPSNMESQ